MTPEEKIARARERVNHAHAKLDEWVIRTENAALRMGQWRKRLAKDQATLRRLCREQFDQGENVEVKTGTSAPSAEVLVAEEVKTPPVSDPGAVTEPGAGVDW